mmetsp:Transcript_6533/g.11684  ORF Transcript_6533/g.11684 Transcript_6533/m.11684 type:complete len:287 (-) Transcript_6533:214-1074(-)
MKLAVGIIPLLALLSSVEVLGWKEHCKCFEEITRNKRNFCRKRRGLKGYAESGVGDAENSKYQNVVDLFYERGLSAQGMDGEQEENIDDTSNERDLISDTDSEFYDLFAEEIEEDTSEFDENEVDFAHNLSSLGDDVSGESRELRGCSRLKMWHKYAWSCWQFELKDRKWCMTYRKQDNSFRVERCGKSSSLQKVNMLSNQRIQVGGKCLEHGGKTIKPSDCESKNKKQHWNFDKDKGRGIEIHPANSKNMCITQDHHPKSDEELIVVKCSTPKRTFHRSAWWQCY